MYKVLVFVFYIISTGEPDPHAVLMPVDFDCNDRFEIARTAEMVRDDHKEAAADIKQEYKVICVDQIFEHKFTPGI